MTSAGTRPVPNTMTLGAVATGSMKAQEALMAAGIISSLGSIPAPKAAAARMGINRVVVAVLLVVSVKKVMLRQITTMIASTGQAERPARAPPRASLKPEAVKAWAMLMPAPNRMSMPQGIFTAVSQSSRRPPRPSGVRNMATAARKATMASLE